MLHVLINVELIERVLTYTYAGTHSLSFNTNEYEIDIKINRESAYFYLRRYALSLYFKTNKNQIKISWD